MTHLVDLPEVFRLTLRATHQGVFDLNVQTGEAFVSPEYASMIGYDPATFVESNAAWLNRVHPDDRARVGKDYVDYIEGRSASYRTEFRLRTADGDWKWILSLGCIVERTADARPLRMVGTHTDITERKRQEERQRAAEADLRLQSAALNAAVDAILIADGHGAMRWVNAAFGQLTGYPPADLLGHTINMFRPAVADYPIHDLWTTLRAGHPWIGEVQVTKRDGSACTASAALTPVIRADGVPHHFIGVLRDITESKRLQQAQLEAQKMEIVGRLAGTVAHDFNNLLGVIKGTADLAALGLPPDAPLRADLDAIRHASDRAAVLTRQLLAFTRKHVAEPRAVDLNATLMSLQPMLARTIGETITIGLRPSAVHARIHVDPNQLEQVIMNLIVNAKDAMPSGGHVTIETRDAGDRAALVVSDTGEGITPTVLPHIFEPFFTTKDTSKGTGLGLSTVSNIVAGGGGTIEVKSQLGAGSSFTVTWPRIQDAPALLPVAPSPFESAATVLIVEDNAPLLALTARVLKGAGCAVVTASSSEAAEGALQMHLSRIDLLLTDVILPGASGLVLAERARARHPFLPVLFMSGYPDEELGRLTVEKLKGQLIRKPFSASELIAAVADALSLSADRRALPAPHAPARPQPK